MSREYAVSAGGLTIGGAITGVFINPPATGPSIEILRAWIGQRDISTSTMQRVQIVTQVTAFPTLTSATPRKFKQGDPTSAITGGTAGAAGTCGVNASAEGAGAKTQLLDDVFNVLSGWLWVPTPNETIILPAGSSSGLGIYLPVAPATLTNWTFGLVFREIG